MISFNNLISKLVPALPKAITYQFAKKYVAELIKNQLLKQSNHLTEMDT